MITDWSPTKDYYVYYDLNGQTFVSDPYPTYKEACDEFEIYANNPKYTNITIAKSEVNYIVLKRLTGGH